MHTIGSRIKRVRKLNELNQIEFANTIGVSQGTLSELEMDKYKPSIETVMAIRDKFQTDINWLLYGTLNDSNKELNHEAISEEEFKVIEALRKLNNESREDIITFINIKLTRQKR